MSNTGCTVACSHAPRVVGGLNSPVLPLSFPPPSPLSPVSALPLSLLFHKINIFILFSSVAFARERKPSPVTSESGLFPLACSPVPSSYQQTPSLHSSWPSRTPSCTCHISLSFVYRWLLCWWHNVALVERAALHTGCVESLCLLIPAVNGRSFHFIREHQVFLLLLGTSRSAVQLCWGRGARGDTAEGSAWRQQGDVWLTEKARGRSGPPQGEVSGHRLTGSSPSLLGLGHVCLPPSRHLCSGGWWTGDKYP